MFDHFAKAEFVSPKDLQIDRAYQRLMVPAVVKSIVKSFRPEIFGLPTVGRRLDGSLWVVDGQQRVEACKILIENGYDKVHTIPCAIFESEGRQHEASIFLAQDNRRGIQTLEKFKAATIAGEPKSIELKALLESAGYHVAPHAQAQRAWPVIHCVGRLKNLFKKDKDCLEATLMMIDDAWAGDKNAVKELMLWGMFTFIHHAAKPENLDPFNPDRFVRLLRKTTPVALLSRVPKSDNEARFSCNGFDRGEVMCHNFIDRYNFKLARKNRVSLLPVRKGI